MNPSGRSRDRMLPHASERKSMPLRRIAALLLVAIAAALSGCGVNAIPSFEEQAKAAWSQVLNQYQRRADLIPNLVETVRASAAHER